jgi:hypothetical protein
MGVFLRLIASSSLLLMAACGAAHRVELRAEARDVEFRSLNGEVLGSSPLVLEGEKLLKVRQPDGRVALRVSAPGHVSREVVLDVHGQDLHELKLSTAAQASFRDEVLPQNKTSMNRLVRELFEIQGLILARKTDAAQKAVGAFLEQYPTIAAGYVFQANLFLLAGRREEARLQLVRAKALDSGDATIQRMLASVEDGK